MKTCIEDVLRCASGLKKTGLRGRVDSRLADFKSIGSGSDEEIFSELCFCLLTANYSAEGGIRIQRALGNGFLTLGLEELETRLRELGHRFPKARANYIFEARKHKKGIRERVNSFSSEEAAREWFAENVKGLGYKEASHFLRNIGFRDLAIIDFHIIDILERKGAIERPKTLTRGRYTEIERVLRKIANELGMNLAELDLYLWYAETGKLLK